MYDAMMDMMDESLSAEPMPITNSLEIKPIADSASVDDSALWDQVLARLTDPEEGPTLTESDSVSSSKRRSEDPPCTGAADARKRRVSIGDDELSSSSELPPSDRTQAKAVPKKTDAASPPGGNTGRWTKEEHRRYLVAFRQHPRRWKKIALFVGTRTKAQVRTHALKFHERLAREAIKRKEDARKASAGEAGRNEERPSESGGAGGTTETTQTIDESRDCCAPCDGNEGALAVDDSEEGRRGRWKPEEHSLFVRASEVHGRDWQKIAAVVKTRSATQVRTHAQKFYQKMGRSKLVRNDVVMQNEKEGSAKSKSKTESTADSIQRGSTVTATLPSAAPRDEISESNRKRRKVCDTDAKTGCPAPPQKLGQHCSAPPKIAAVPASPTPGPSRGAATDCDSGEWTQEEHALFLMGTLLYKNDWKKVAEHVKTRSAVQVETHMQDWYTERLLRQEWETLLEM